ncbi:hypothetical protein PMAYCL1PPCAC_20121, partial [Pristionchus mayeri]
QVRGHEEKRAAVEKKLRDEMAQLNVEFSRTSKKRATSSTEELSKMQAYYRDKIKAKEDEIRNAQLEAKTERERDRKSLEDRLKEMLDYERTLRECKQRQERAHTEAILSLQIQHHEKVEEERMV